MLTEHAWDRKFGESLPTLEDVMNEADVMSHVIKYKDEDGGELPQEEAREALGLICKMCNLDFIQKTPKTQLQYSATQACGIGLPVLSFKHSALNTHFTKGDVEDFIFELPYEIKSKVENICSKTNEELKQLTKSQRKVYEIYKQENVINQYSKFFNNE